MHSAEYLSAPAPVVSAELDDLTQLELSIAQRADELMRHNHGDGVRRDFWQEAENEILAGRFEALALAVG